MFSEISKDVSAALKRDPAARSKIEILLTYAGVRAILMHRVAHWLWGHGLHLIARLLSEVARFVNGIEIHPAAKIGEGVFIDHGTGVVIGETAEVGNHVLMYQGVTLGGTGKTRGKRHPTVGSSVTIGAGAKILGAITIGDNVVIGAGSVVLKPVPANATAVGVPARVVVQNGKRVDEPSLEHGKVPDPCDKCMELINSHMDALSDRIRALEQEIERLKEARRPMPASRTEP
ncbi:MAG: serine O-acetyltransferase [Armatimonadota bacterium]|nr:MAG: serine O-acetyltransferase [Armatimonadota bacterium]